MGEQPKRHTYKVHVEYHATVWTPTGFIRAEVGLGSRTRREAAQAGRRVAAQYDIQDGIIHPRQTKKQPQPDAAARA